MKWEAHLLWSGYVHRPRNIWYFGDGCQSKLSLIQPYNLPISNMYKMLSNEENERIVRPINGCRRKESQEQHNKQHLKEANKMLNKETLQDQLKQIAQTIEGTEAALKGMRSYKTLLEAGIKNHEVIESVAIMPATLAKGLMDWANIWGGGK